MSWETLLAIAKEAAYERDRDRYQRPTECPNDGTTLVQNRAGVWGCTFDGYTWNG